MLERCVVGRFPVLNVLGNGDVRDAAVGERGLDRLVDDIVHVRRPHHALVVDGDVHEQLVEIHVLLVMGADQIVKGVAGDRQHRLAVELRIVKSVQQVNAAGAGGREADAQASGEFGVAAGGERGGFLMPHLDELHLSWCVRKASKMPLMPSPGNPKIVSTPQSASLLIKMSPTVSAMVIPRYRLNAYLTSKPVASPANIPPAMTAYFGPDLACSRSAV